MQIGGNKGGEGTEKYRKKRVDKETGWSKKEEGGKGFCC